MCLSRGCIIIHINCRKKLTNIFYLPNGLSINKRYFNQNIRPGIHDLTIIRIITLNNTMALYGIQYSDKESLCSFYCLINSNFFNILVNNNKNAFKNYMVLVWKSTIGLNVKLARKTSCYYK